jgi:hypothetical protein
MAPKPPMIFFDKVQNFTPISSIRQAMRPSHHRFQGNRLKNAQD